VNLHIHEGSIDYKEGSKKQHAPEQGIKKLKKL
jgi:hypothetical protein